MRAAWLAAADLAPLTEHTVTDPSRLAELIETAGRDGFALVDQQLEESLRSIAVPVTGPDGRVVAAANVSLHASRASADDILTTVLPALRETTHRIAEDAALVYALHPLTTMSRTRW